MEGDLPKTLWKKENRYRDVPMYLRRAYVLVHFDHSQRQTSSDVWASFGSRFFFFLLRPHLFRSKQKENLQSKKNQKNETGKRTQTEKRIKKTYMRAQLYEITDRRTPPGVGILR